MQVTWFIYCFARLERSDTFIRTEFNKTFDLYSSVPSGEELSNSKKLRLSWSGSVLECKVEEGGTVDN